MVPHADEHSNRPVWCNAQAGPGLSRPDSKVDYSGDYRVDLYGRWSSGDRCGRESLVREGQPLHQQPRCFIWRLTVERHHRRGHTGPAAQLRAPPVADVRDLDLVRTPADGFFESVHGHVLCCPGGVGASDDSTLRGGAIKRSRTRRAPPPREARQIAGVER